MLGLQRCIISWKNSDCVVACKNIVDEKTPACNFSLQQMWQICRFVFDLVHSSLRYFHTTVSVLWNWQNEKGAPFFKGEPKKTPQRSAIERFLSVNTLSVFGWL